MYRGSPLHLKHWEAGENLCPGEEEIRTNVECISQDVIYLMIVDTPVAMPPQASNKSRSVRENFAG